MREAEPQNGRADSWYLQGLPCLPGMPDFPEPETSFTLVLS
jgi:hypothetical protein